MSIEISNNYTNLLKFIFFYYLIPHICAIIKQYFLSFMKGLLKMDNKNTNALKNDDSFLPMLKYIASFFAAMMLTYLVCLKNEGSVWFSLTFAVAAGILAMCVCHAYDTEGRVHKGNYYIFMSAMFSFLAIGICYMALGVYPFGEESVMIIDMHHQYSSFFSLIREKITSFESLSYSDSVGMGAGLIPLIAYYLCSPYNIIALILPRENLTEAIALIEVLKIASAGATFAIFCRGVFKKNDYGTVALSVAYAMSAYFIAYSWNVMWLDCLVLLPLIVYGLEKVLNGKSPLLYCITLGLAITTNYYIGYMICIYLVLWFVMRLVEENDQYSGLTLSKKAIAWLKKLGRFAWTSIVGGMLSMWILIPTAISLSATSGADDEFAREIKSNFDFWDIFSRLLYGNSPTERGDNLPNIYCSILAVFMIAVFLFCRKIKLRTRVSFMGLLGTLVLLLANNWTNFAFHGFHFPNDLPYRQAFLISFTVLTMAVQALDKIHELDSNSIFKTFTLVAAMLVLEQKFSSSDSEYTIVWYSLGFLAVYAVITGLMTSKDFNKKSTALALTAAVVFVEVSANSVSMITQLNENEVFTNRVDFVYDYDVNKAAVSKVEEINTDGSRMEILPRKTCNDNALYDYSGLTVFASSNAESTTTLMGSLGYAINGVNSYIYNSYVPLVDSMLNLKYIAFDHDIGTHAQLSYVDSVTDGYGNYRYIYENTLALSRGFTVNNDIIYWDPNDLNPFSVQDKFLEYGANCEPVYDLLPLTASATSNMNVEFSDSYFYAELQNDGTGSFTATHTMTEQAQTYVYVDCRAASGISVSVGGSSWGVTTYEPYIIDLGKLAVGTEINVDITSEISCSGNIFIASMNTDNLSTAIQTLGKNQWNITEYSDGYFKGDITADSDCTMFTSIPYNDGWSVYVDGKKTETVKIGDAMIGVPLTAGSHTVEMKYHTDGFPLGMTMTVIAVLILVLWSMRKKLIYPMLREYVPVLYNAIDSEGDGSKPSVNTPIAFDEFPEHYSADTDDAVEGFENDFDDAPADILTADENPDEFEITEDNRHKNN